ncbi:MAG: hypothetical protein K0R73_63 [Candidatus Midichloriaceae bacterium]|jgi:hypothetical protein|nr:hypothetical protein [Candidatus Midichloriaceae bacterium]
MNKRTAIMVIFLIGIINPVLATEDRSNDNEYIMPLALEQQDEVDNFNFEVFESVDRTQFDLPDCSTSMPNLQTCEPQVCKLKAAFGDIFVKIKGMKEDKCLYVERTLAIDGINCQFEKNDLSQLNDAFAQRLQKLSGRSISMSEATISKLKTVFQNNCISVPDYNLRKIIPINKFDTNEIDPEFANIWLKKKVNQTQFNQDDPYYESNNHSERLNNYKPIMVPRD